MADLTTSYGPDRSLQTSIPGVARPDNSFGGLTPDILKLLMLRSRGGQPGPGTPYGSIQPATPQARPGVAARGSYGGGQMAYPPQYEQPQYGLGGGGGYDAPRQLPRFSYGYQGKSFAGSAPTLPTQTGWGREGEDFILDDNAGRFSAGGVSHGPQGDPRAAQQDDYDTEFQRRLPKPEPKKESK